MDLAVDGNVYQSVPWWSSLEELVRHRHEYLVASRLLHPCLPLDPRSRRWYPTSYYRCDGEPMVLSPPRCSFSHIKASRASSSRSFHHDPFRHYLLLNSLDPPHPSAPTRRPTPHRRSPWSMHIHTPPQLNRHSHAPRHTHLQRHPLATSRLLIPSSLAAFLHGRFESSYSKPLTLPQCRLHSYFFYPPLQSRAPLAALDPPYHIFRFRFRRLGQYRSLAHFQRRSSVLDCAREPVRLYRWSHRCSYRMGNIGCYGGSADGCGGCGRGVLG